MRNGMALLVPCTAVMASPRTAKRWGDPENCADPTCLPTSAVTFSGSVMATSVTAPAPSTVNCAPVRFPAEAITDSPDVESHTMSCNVAVASPRVSVSVPPEVALREGISLGAISVGATLLVGEDEVAGEGAGGVLVGVGVGAGVPVQAVRDIVARNAAQLQRDRRCAAVPMGPEYRVVSRKPAPEVLVNVTSDTMPPVATNSPVVEASSQTSGLDRYFGITRRGSTMGREVRGGLVTFFAMAYIIALNPLILGTAVDMNGNLISGAPQMVNGEIDSAAVAASIGMVAAATALIAGIITILMGIIGRFPMGLAAGLGLNALVAYTLAPQMTWGQAMGLVVWEGILISILVLTGFRTAVFKAVPPALRSAISVGIGLFIAFVGLINAGVVRRGGGTVVSLGIDGSLMGWPIFVFLFGFFLLIALHARKVKGSILISILASTVLAIIVEAITKVGAQGADGANPTGWALNVPRLADFQFPDLSLLGNVDMIGAFFPDGKFSVTHALALIVLVFSLLLADFFDTMGTIMAVGSEGDLLDEEGFPERTTEILLVDSFGAIAGGLGSVSSNTCYVESTTGVGEGARTGFASVVTGLAFIASIFLAPIINMVPSEAASPALAFVGFLMISQVVEIDWTKPELGIPAFFTIIFMPFAYSVTTGIGVGFLAYVFLSIVMGKAKQIHSLMYVVAVMFIIYFVQGPILDLIAA